MSRRTRSGAEFSPFTLGTAVKTSVDLVELLQARFAELDTQGDRDESEDELGNEFEGPAMVSLLCGLLSARHPPSVPIGPSFRAQCWPERCNNAVPTPCYSPIDPLPAHRSSSHLQPPTQRPPAHESTPAWLTPTA